MLGMKLEYPTAGLDSAFLVLQNSRTMDIYGDIKEEMMEGEED